MWVVCWILYEYDFRMFGVVVMSWIITSDLRGECADREMERRRCNFDRLGFYIIRR
jgi:hypothetical protein